MEQARTQLASFTTLPKAADILATFIREALRVLQPGPLRVCLPEGDGALLDAAIRKSLGAGRWALRFETDAIPGGGVIVETEDGRLRFDNSLDARMRRHRNDLRQLAADALFTETEIPEAHGTAGDR
jgi:vacuolar-type H+-ATPase subunit E/Vma4